MVDNSGGRFHWGFMQVPVDDDLPEVACDFVKARGARFIEGRPC